ncbi:DUF2711 family protein [Litchfieldia alkalitelluris]|uniref:DUF2711 family protein n=1 Tax=Litchfieldia alkalitelluris TaxID=304268 RepID=UPI001F2F0E2B|nr:DUF2711 family protein [Litchfieldia alkalitelluris]
MKIKLSNNQAYRYYYKKNEVGVVMTNSPRILPPPHKYAVCAPADIPIREYYKDVLEVVYLFYHPFLTSGSKTVSWETFLHSSGLNDLKQLDIGLRTIITGLKKKYADYHASKITLEVCEEKGYTLPSEGVFPTTIMNDIFSSIQKLGHDWLWCGDEHGTERKLEHIDDLANDENIYIHCRNLFTYDHQLLITTHWDSHFSMLCSNSRTVQDIVENCKLEGFYCGDTTEIYWSIFG